MRLRISEFNPFAQLLVYTGSILVHIFLFTLVAMFCLIPFWGQEILHNPAILQDLTSEKVINSLKFIQFFSQLGMLTGALLVLKLISSDNNLCNYLQCTRLNFRINKIYWLFLLVIVMTPFLNWLTHLNGMIQLPAGMYALEQWLITQEQQNDLLIEAFTRNTHWHALLINILLMAGATAIIEEIVFRGGLLTLFTKIFYNKHIAVFISAFIFALIHFQFFKLLPMLLIGVFLGYLYVQTKSLWYPILFHFINNAGAVITMHLINTGRIDDNIENFGTQPQHFLFVLLSAILVFGIIYILLKRNQPAN